MDQLTTQHALENSGHGDRREWRGYLTSLAESVPSASNVGTYARIVIGKATERALCEATDRAVSIARGTGTPDEKLDAVAAAIGAVQRPGAYAGPRHVAELVRDRIDHWQSLADGTVEPGIATGLPKLDRALGGGLKPGRVVVVAARPSIGKTSLATQVLLHIGVSRPCLFLSLEMTAGELTDRAVANAGRVSLELVASGQMDGDDSARLTEGADLLSRLHVFVDDTPALSLLDIRAKARRLQQKHGLAVLVLDYLQLSKAADTKTQNRHHQIEAISRGLKVLAKELCIAVVVLSQLNRQSTSRPDGEPTLSDLKESGAIEEDADTVILLHPKGNLADGTMLIAGIIAKNRQGRRGRIALSFAGATQRWTEVEANVAGGAA